MRISHKCHGMCLFRIRPPNCVTHISVTPQWINNNPFLDTFGTRRHKHLCYLNKAKNGGVSYNTIRIISRFIVPCLVYVRGFWFDSSSYEWCPCTCARNGSLRWAVYYKGLFRGSRPDENESTGNKEPVSKHPITGCRGSVSGNSLVSSFWWEYNIHHYEWTRIWLHGMCQMNKIKKIG